MAASPAKFLFGFLFISVIVWMNFIFFVRLVARYLYQKLGISMELRFGGWKCLRDIVVKFKEGAVESISISEIRPSIRQSLVRLGVVFSSRDPKLQVLISDLEIVLRSSHTTTRNRRSGKPCNSGRGIFMIIAAVARFLSFSLSELVVKTPRATIEVKELKVDITRDCGSRPTLFVRLHLSSISVHICDQCVFDHFSSSSHEIYTSVGEPSFMMAERPPAPFSCEELSLSCEFGHDRDLGVVIRNFDVASGEVTVNLNEELFLNNKSSVHVFTDSSIGSTVGSVALGKPHKKHTLAIVTTFVSLLPEKVGFNLPKLDVSFVHRGQGLFFQNNIMGIQLRSMKFQSNDDVGESTCLDVQMEFSEIHIFREAGTSVLEILKVDVVSSVYVPTQTKSSIRVEIDVKLGGTWCNLNFNRLRPLVQLPVSKKKTVVLRKESSSLEKQLPSDFKVFMWTATLSAPEMTIVLYSVNSLPLYHACSQSSHLFANNISRLGTSAHMDLGEINLHMADEYQENLNGSLFGVEANLNSLMHIANVSLDLGKKDVESFEENCPKCELVLSVDVTGMGIHFNFMHLKTLTLAAISLQTLLKSLSSGRKMSQNRGSRSSETTGNGIRLLKFNLERCSVNFSGVTGLENTVIEDPKCVNYGSQGGQVTVSILADGTPRSASIMSTISDECKKLKYSVSLDIFHFSLSTNKDKKSTQMLLERARSIYQEYPEEQRLGAKVVLFDMQKAKFVHRSGGLREIAVYSYFSASDITVKWEPDVHLSLLELTLHLKLLVHNQKFQEIEDEHMIETSRTGSVGSKKEAATESGQNHKKLKKMESVFAIDVESLSLSAEAGDGVDVVVQIQSFFSENARIGVLFEGLMLSFNDCRVLKSGRMQISRIPSSSTSIDAKLLAPTTWDWVIQGLDVQICMPFRLQLRAIEDAIEDMLRGLKLIAAAKMKLINPPKKESSKPKNPSTVKLGCLKLCIHKITADIEEEPIQGWLDEHYHLMKNEACKLAVRLESLEDLISRRNEPSRCSETDSTHERKFSWNGIEVDLQDPAIIYQMREEIYKQSFRSYYHACQNLMQSEGSRVCRQGFQAGFKPSTARTSLFSLSAMELDVSLTRIDGSDDGVIEVLRKLDPVCRENNIPFSRLLGRKVFLRTGSLVVQLRNFMFPLFSGTSGKCEGCVVLAQQATCFQPQIHQDVFIGRWRKVRMLRSASGTTPPMKTYMELPISFQKAEVSYGVSYEPVFADVSYAFTVALRRANLSVRSGSCNNTLNPSASSSFQVGHTNFSVMEPPKKERALPWWDDVRYYIHGHITLYFSETKWNVLATTDPYEKLDKLEVNTNYMELQQSDGRVYLYAKDFKFLVSSLESLVKNRSLKLPPRVSGAFLEAPAFCLEVKMDWECSSGNPLNHYLHALPNEGKPRKKVYDPFRSISLSQKWNFLLRPSYERQVPYSTVACNPPYMPGNSRIDSPTMNFGAHDLAWVFKFWNINYIPPHKLRTFSRWPRFGIPRVARSGNLSLDKVMTKFMLCIDAAPACIRHMPLHDDDPAKGLIFKIAKLKHEMYYSRGKQKYTFECKRDPLDLVYQCLDLHVPKVYLNKENCTSVAKVVQMTRSRPLSASMDRVANETFNYMSNSSEKLPDDGFLLSSDRFTIRRQALKADPASLLAWQEAGRTLETMYVRSEFENGSEIDEHMKSDPSDDDGSNVIKADNCQCVFVYRLKLLWTIENRDAVWSFVGGISKAFEDSKPSPSRQYAQRKVLEKTQVSNDPETVHYDILKLSSTSHLESLPSPRHVETSDFHSSSSHSVKMENSPPVSAEKGEFINDDSKEEGTDDFMVEVIEPQFNLHSEEANGRFLLAAVRGNVSARSFRSVRHVGHEIIEQLGTGNIHIPECGPEMTWRRMEISVMLEQVQAHVAPTDVDPGAGLQWLPKIGRSSPEVKRTGALLERVFIPCGMYFQYTRCKGGTPDLKVKPLKETIFNSEDITATMTSRQFRVMLDVLSNLLFARLPKPRKSCLSYPSEDDEDVEEEADEMVPEGVEEVELARVNLEQNEWDLKLLLDDIRKLSICCDTSTEPYPEKEYDLWMITGGTPTLVQQLTKELGNVQKCRKVASASLRTALQKAVQLRLMEKDKNKRPSYAMRISLQIKKVVWTMLVDGKPFAEAEINDMIFDFERDYKDVGAARFTTKYFVVRNCLPNAKSDMLLSAWSPPSEWGKKVMVRVDAKQGAPKDGNSPLELFQVEIYPLKIHLTERMYKMMWEYFFPEEELDSQRRQEVWKVSTTAGAKRVKKGSSIHDASASNIQSSKDPEAVKLQNIKANIDSYSGPEKRRTSSFEGTLEENVCEPVANELAVQVHPASISCEPLVSVEQREESSKNKLKDSKPMKSGRSLHEEKKVSKSHDEKKPRPRKMMEFHNIKISQVELLVTYEGRISVSELWLLMDPFHRVEFTGTWRRLFSRVKKHIIWGVLKSVTGMQGKKFKEKAHTQNEHSGDGVPDGDFNFSDSDGGQAGNSDQYPTTWLKRPSDGGGDGFVTSIKGLFTSQRRKAKAFMRTMRGEAENEYHGECSETDSEFSPVTKQLTITKKLIRRGTKKFGSRGQKGFHQRDSAPSSPKETTPFESHSSGGSSPYEDFHE